MSDKDLRYSGLVILRVSSDWKLDVLGFIIDDNPEFLKQWISHQDHPLESVLKKMKRIIKIFPLVVSMDPVYSHFGNNIIEFYACIVTSRKRLPKKIDFYQTVKWFNPRTLYLLLKDDVSKAALMASVEWTRSDRFTPLILARNNLFIR